MSADIELVEQHSRFIGFAHPCNSVSAFKSYLEELESDHPNATHIAYAYRIIDPGGQVTARFNDAGEPPGTAGKPIFSHLEGHDLINCAVFVVRYFGGTKLGTGGLVKAYGQTAKLLIQTTQVISYTPQVGFAITASYQDLKQLEYLLEHLGALIINKSFAAQAHLQIHLAESEKDLFLKELQIRLPNCQALPLKIPG